MITRSTHEASSSANAMKPGVSATLILAVPFLAMATFVRSITDKGIPVAVMGYYLLPEDAPEFDGCIAHFPELSRRQALLADSSNLIIFVDGAAAMSPDNREAFDGDRIHPSPVGSALLGNAIADAVRGAID